MTLQFQIDFEQKLPASAQLGMQQADDNADCRWKRVIDGCIQLVARRQQEFTVDEVILAMQALPNPPNTHCLAALGPRMKEVAKTLKYMKSTDRVQRSKREASHGNFLRVWESLIWEDRK
jgi:tRNA(Ile2) C34 agmatinyltransferase TiaS